MIRQLRAARYVNVFVAFVSCIIDNDTALLYDAGADNVMTLPVHTPTISQLLNFVRQYGNVSRAPKKLLATETYVGWT